jgi:hypothetical protein
MENNMSKKLIPFGLLPGHWGIAGKSRAIAKAEYELVGLEQELAILHIKQDEYTDHDYITKQIELKNKYDQYSTQIDYLRALANNIVNEDQRNLAILELDFKDSKITENEYQKQSATMRGEPWVTVLNMDFGGELSLEGSFELDWNDYFVANLIKEGYEGATPDAIVNLWFMTICKNVALEEFDGTGNFTGDADANLEAMRRWNSNESRAVKKVHK